MRLPVLIALTAFASPAAAQSGFDTLHAENRLAARQELARQRALAADREALVMESRVRTGAALASLEAARITAAAEIEVDPRIAADIEAVARLQAKALAESNARILAITQGDRD